MRLFHRDVKPITFLAVLLFIFGTACRKDYTCVCTVTEEETYSSGGASGKSKSVPQSTTTYYKSKTRTQIKKLCASDYYESSADIAYPSGTQASTSYKYSTTCEIK